MGAVGYYRPKGESDRDHIQREVCGERLTILDCVTKGTTFYAAVRDKDTDEVFGLVVLQTRGRDGYYTRKAMSEDEGPCYYDCPDRILDRLTPTENAYAVGWRDKCRAKNAARAARPTVKAGDRVRFADPLTFTNGMTFDTFTFVKGSTFEVTERAGYPYRVRITRWRDRRYEVLTTATVA